MINPKEIIRGDISITDNLPFIKDLLQNSTNPMVRIISMEEENILPLNHPMVIGGTCLLPPIDALMAEADGNELLYDRIYNDHFNAQFPSEYISAILIYLYTGRNLIIYLPNQNSNTFKKFIQIMWKRYGIQPGIIGVSNPVYDPTCLPIWLNMIYRCMDPYEYLRLYPADAAIPPHILDEIIIQLKIYGGSWNDKIKEIQKICQLIKTIPNIRSPICSESKPGEVAFNNGVNYRGY